MVTKIAAPKISAQDVAALIIEEVPGLDDMKLQKLLYYAQAWHLGWYGEPLFKERIEAWKDGPVVRSVWETYQDYGEAPIPRARGGNPGVLSRRARGVVDAIAEAYGRLPGLDLRQATHDEDPWIDAWGQRQHARWGNKEITRESLRRFFSGSARFPAPGGTKIAEEVDRATALAFIQGDEDAIERVLLGRTTS